MLRRAAAATLGPSSRPARFDRFASGGEGRPHIAHRRADARQERPGLDRARRRSRDGAAQRLERHRRLVVARLPDRGNGRARSQARLLRSRSPQQVCRGARASQRGFGLPRSAAGRSRRSRCPPPPRRPRAPSPPAGAIAALAERSRLARTSERRDRSGRDRDRSRPAVRRRPPPGPSRRGPRARATRAPAAGPPTRACRAPRAARRGRANRAARGSRRAIRAAAGGPKTYAGDDSCTTASASRGLADTRSRAGVRGRGPAVRPPLAPRRTTLRATAVVAIDEHH